MKSSVGSKRKRPATEESAYSQAAEAFEIVEKNKVEHFKEMSSSLSKLVELATERQAFSLRKVEALERIASAKEEKNKFLFAKYNK